MIESINELTTNNGLTTICTIHQPPVDVFLSFDRLLLLEKGAVVYSGPPAKCADFFSSEGFICPPSANPADFYFKVGGGGGLYGTQKPFSCLAHSTLVIPSLSRS